MMLKSLFRLNGQLIYITDSLEREGPRRRIDPLIALIRKWMIECKQNLPLFLSLLIKN
jgi:hypothetical protein